MKKNYKEVVILESKYCDFCEKHNDETIAKYDAKTIFGPWANMCEEHFQTFGSELGLGRGQKLILKKGKK